MFDDSYEFDYDRVLEDSDELYDEYDHWDDEDYEDEDVEWDNYYHNVADELIDE